VVVKFVADMRRQGGELMVGQFRPDAPGELTGANIIKLRPGQTEMIQGFAQMFDVEGGVMRNHEVGADQPGQKFRRNGWKFRCIQNIQMSQAVTFNEVWPKPSMRFGWPHQPMRSLGQCAIFKDRHPGGADANAGIIGRFKIYAGDGHRVWRQERQCSFCPLNLKWFDCIITLNFRTGVKPRDESGVPKASLKTQ
jgi:hypothetical protein